MVMFIPTTRHRVSFSLHAESMAKIVIKESTVNCP